MNGMYTLSGLVVGLVAGVNGVSGRSLTKALSGWVNGRRGTVDWKVAGLGRCVCDTPGQ
jgi:hypothetical protein